jgi:diaminopimelate epimerase
MNIPSAIPFVKAHGARNDFLLAWENDAPPDRLGRLAADICDRHAGVGADGLLLVRRLEKHETGADAMIRLFNPDGGEVEISGNGTRCAAAFLLDAHAAGEQITLETGAGRKHLWMRGRHSLYAYELEMNMGEPAVEELMAQLNALDEIHGATILNAGNPQCAVLVDTFDFDWRRLGAALEAHPRFPQRSNVSFVRVLDRQTLDVRFYERGAGVTASSGTGSTGAFAAAFARGLVDDAVVVRTEGGPLVLRWQAGGIHLVGPAEIVARGTYFLAN